MTPLLTRIERELATCTDPLLAAELRAERACYFARTGNFDGAKAISAALRKEYGDGSSVRISVWTMLAEGLVLYFDQTDLQARDKILRAYALSDAASLLDLRALTAAWLAHVEFNRSEFDSMLALLRRLVDSHVYWNDAVAVRFHLLVADSYMYCGETQIAGEWYQKARLAAVESGDQASIAALIYNKAALALAHMRVRLATDEPDLRSLRFISMEIESAYNFHVGTAHASLVQLIEISRARALLSEHRFEEARMLFESLLARSRLALGLRSDRLLMEVEYAQALLESNLKDEARARFLEIRPENYVQLTIDDQLVFLISYVAVGRALQLDSEVAEYVEPVIAVETRYRAGVGSLKAGLDKVCRRLI